jgi:DNA replication protein DnaC
VDLNISNDKEKQDMLNNPTLDKLLELKLTGMVKALKQQEDMPELTKLSFDERFGLLVDAEYSERENANLVQRLKVAKLRHAACVEDLDFKEAHGLDRRMIAQISACNWIKEGLNVLITGKTGVGKTYLACALAQKACRLGFASLYMRAPRFFQELTVARLSGKYSRLLTRLAKFDLLVLDDFALVPVTDEQSRDLLEVTDDRCGKNSLIVAAQLPVDHWHQTFANKTLADAILDGVVHQSYKLSLEGDSRRKNKKKNDHDTNN